MFILSKFQNFQLTVPLDLTMKVDDPPPLPQLAAAVLEGVAIKAELVDEEEGQDEDQLVVSATKLEPVVMCDVKGEAVDDPLFILPDDDGGPLPDDDVAIGPLLDDDADQPDEDRWVLSALLHYRCWNRWIRIRGTVTHSS